MRTYLSWQLQEGAVAEAAHLLEKGMNRPIPYRFAAVVSK